LVSNIFFAHFLLLFDQGVYWDDWGLYLGTSNEIIQNFKDNGLVIFGYVHAVLQQLPFRIFIYNFLTFIIYLFSGYLLYKILSNLNIYDEFDLFFIVSIFLIAPLNITRVAMIIFPYSLSYFLFFLSLYLLQLNLQKNKQSIYLRLITLIIFFITFQIASFLVFYLLTLLLIYFYEKRNGYHTLAILLKNIDYIILPIFYWIIRSIYFKTSGPYIDYNTITIYNAIFLLPYRIVTSFYSSIIEVINNTLSSFDIFWFVILLILFTQFFKKNSNEESFVNRKEGKLSYDKIYFSLSFLFIVVSMVPYLFVGKMVLNEGWDIRNQLLLPLGFSFFIYFGLKLFLNLFTANRIIQIVIVSVFISGFLIININYYLDFNRDWIKQLSIIENLKNSDEIKNNHSFYLVDDTENLNAINRTYSVLEFSGLMYAAFGTKSKIAINDKQIYKEVLTKSIHNWLGYSTLKDYKKLENPQYKIEIQNGPFKLDRFTQFRLFMLKFWNKVKYDEIVSNVIKIKVTPLENQNWKDLIKNVDNNIQF
jgi:hypothetical protein